MNKRVIVSEFGGPDVVRMVEEPLPYPGTGQVRVRVVAAGVSYADLLMREGVHPETKSPPFTPGWDIVGRVDEVGEAVTSFAIGQWVAGLPIRGGYAEYICMKEADLVPIPTGLDPGEAVALVLNYVTAYQMMHRTAKGSPGERALIHSAAGGVGSALLELGGLIGLEMFGTASPSKKERLSKAGATWIDYKSSDFVDGIHRYTPKGVDIVFDGIGGDHIWRSRQALDEGGRVIAFGLTSSLKNGSLNQNGRSRMKGLPRIALYIALASILPARKRIRLYSIQNLKRLKPGWFLQDLADLFQLLVERKIKPVIAQRFPLSEAPEAHRLLATGTVVGKLVLDCSEGGE